MSGYLVTVRSSDVRRIVLNDGDTVLLHLRDADSLGTQTIYVEGLVSDGKRLELNGELSLLVGSNTAALDFPTNLKPSGTETVLIDVSQIKLDIVRNLSGEISNTVSFSGSIAVSRVFGGSREQMVIADAPSTLSASVFTMVSDWSEELISDLSEKTIDEMVYKEVGG